MNTSLILHIPFILIYFILSFNLFKNKISNIKWFLALNCVVAIGILILKVFDSISYFQGESGHGYTLELAHLFYFFIHIIFVLSLFFYLKK